MSRLVRRFQRVRADHASETAEDYTELVLTLGEGGKPVRAVDIARELGVSHVTVLRGLARLERDGYVQRSRVDGVALTASGRRLAERARERHQVVLDFLLALGVPQRQALIDSEGLEHHVSQITLDCMQRAIEPLAAMPKQGRKKKDAPPRKREEGRGDR
jgi:DtxR family manganese transport transcriptional regulator